MNSPGAPSLTWHDGMLLGLEDMDVEHEEFAVLIAALCQAPDTDVGSAFDTLATHARAHFRSEEDWMSRTCFPAHACHAAEHQAVMRSIAGVQDRLREGDIEAARRLGAALADWFPAHADYLDAALAHWVCKQRHGGKPIVLRRHMQPPRQVPASGTHSYP